MKDGVRPREASAPRVFRRIKKLRGGGSMAVTLREALIALEVQASRYATLHPDDKELSHAIADAQAALAGSAEDAQENLTESVVSDGSKAVPQDVAEEQEETRFRMRYVCPQDGTRWMMEWFCPCNDRCPTCDEEIEPFKVEDITSQT